MCLTLFKRTTQIFALSIGIVQCIWLIRCANYELSKIEYFDNATREMLSNKFVSPHNLYSG